jgi:hypothetical protein
VTQLLGIGALAGVAYAVWRAVEQSRRPSGVTWEPRPFPFPPEPRTPADDPNPDGDAAPLT